MQGAYERLHGLQVGFHNKDTSIGRELALLVSDALGALRVYEVFKKFLSDCRDLFYPEQNGTQMNNVLVL